MTSVPPTTGGPLTPEQYARLNFQGKPIEEVEDLLTQIATRRDSHAQDAQTAQEMIDDEIANGNPSGVDALRDLNQERDDNRRDASYYDETITYVSEHADDLGITGLEPEVDPTSVSPGTKAIAGAKAVGGWAKRHPKTTAAVVIGAALVGTRACSDNPSTDPTGNNCTPNIPAAAQIGMNQAQQNPDAASAIAAAKAIVLEQANDCTPQELDRALQAAEDGANAEIKVGGSASSTTVDAGGRDTTTTIDEGSDAPSTTVDTEAPAADPEATPEIDDTIFCGPDGKIVGVTVGSDGTKEKYVGDACEYPGPDVQVPTVDSQGNTDAVIGMGL